jgi:hypothetical protein
MVVLNFLLLLADPTTKGYFQYALCTFDEFLWCQATSRGQKPKTKN